MYLFFDTETTGVPKNYNAPASDVRNWPRLVQLAWLLTNEAGETLASYNEIVRPEGFTIPPEASKVHKITTSRALEQGVALEAALQQFVKASQQAATLIGHNVSFDIKIMGAELYRAQQPLLLERKPWICTMHSSTDYCAIPNQSSYGGKYKWPKLQELHKKLFGHEFEDAHDAMADIQATRNCFFELKKRQVIQ